MAAAHRPAHLGLALGLLLGLAGCAAKIGPGPDGWVKWSLWEGFNIQVGLNPPGGCIGCLLNEPEKAEPVPPAVPTLPDIIFVPTHLIRWR